MHNEHLPIISTRIVFPIGASHEASDKKGLVVMAASTMDEGAGDMKSSEFRKQLQDYNIKFSFGAAQDFFSLTMSFMRFDLTKAEELASIALSDPRFDQEQIDLIRNQILATIDQKQHPPKAWCVTLPDKIIMIITLIKHHMTAIEQASPILPKVI